MIPCCNLYAYGVYDGVYAFLNACCVCCDGVCGGVCCYVFFLCCSHPHSRHHHNCCGLSFYECGYDDSGGHDDEYASLFPWSLTYSWTSFSF
mmetsp:Transcript_22492/g.19451  ORF Transcript_22492/g.19451 Transcript_22492/m.19451 type:complete len:92 (-) Transcript_22492:456-731(-)